MSLPPHADRALLEDRSRSLRSSRSLQLRRCSPPPPSRRRPAPSSSRPPSPRGASPSFSGGGGGVSSLSSSFAFVLRPPHVVKETPGFFVIRMGKDDMPSPTTTRHVLPLWRRCRDAVLRGRQNVSTVVPPQGSDFFEDVYDGDYYDGLQNEDGEDRIAPGSAVLRPRQTWGGA